MSTEQKSPKIRQDLAVRYVHKKAPAEDNVMGQGMVTQSMPLFAMFMRNKFLAWSSLVATIYYSLTQVTSSNSLPGSNTENTGISSATRFLMCFTAIFTCYVDIVFPNAASFAKST